MRKFAKSKYYFLVAFLILVLTLSGILAVTFSSPDLYIRITTIDWPPTVDTQTETYALYHSYLTCEIWNPHKYNLSLETPHTNLLDTKISFKLDDYYEIITGNIAFPIITNHTIKPGVSVFQLVVNFEIHGYNSSLPPPGAYTLWVEVDANNVPFNTKSYETRITFENNETTNISKDQIPLNWGSLSSFPITPVSILLLFLFSTDLIVSVIFYIRKKILDPRSTSDKF